MPQYLSHSVLKRAVALVVDTPLVLVLYLGQLEVMDRLPGEPDRHGEVSVIASHGGPYDEVSLGVIPLSQLLLRLSLSMTWNQSGSGVLPRSVITISPEMPCWLLAI